MKEKLLAAVKAAQQGHDCAYDCLKQETRGLLFKVYDEQLMGSFRLDDWEAEALLVLFDCVRCYSVDDNRAKFSTYYTQAMYNKARDIKRGRVSQKGRFYADMLDFDDLVSKGSCFQTDTYNPERICELKEALLSVSGSDGKCYQQVVYFLLGKSKPQKLQLDKNRQTAQVLYRLKRNVLKALKEG